MIWARHEWAWPLASCPPGGRADQTVAKRRKRYRCPFRHRFGKVAFLAASIESKQPFLIFVDQMQVPGFVLAECTNILAYTVTSKMKPSSRSTPFCIVSWALVHSVEASGVLRWPAFSMSPADAAQVRHRPPSPYSKDEDQVRNWSKYEAGLRRRVGTLAELSRRQAGALTDAATQTSLILHSAFKLLSRQAEGLMDAVLTLMGLTISAAHR